MRASPSGLLRFLTCGSVDDGKSTLLGRLLYDSQALYEDHLDTLASESRRIGTQGDNLDFALLLDGLAAEREQGITIDVAYRYFATPRRQFIIADTPGHEQYTANMVTGASTADCAIVLVDARKGVLTQTRRHSFLVGLLGLRHIALAVNKMDVVDYAEERFLEIEGDYRRFVGEFAAIDVSAIPLSALAGDNVVSRTTQMPWYTGPTLIEYLETVEVEDERAQDQPARLPVQWVNRPSSEFRGFSGMVASGSLTPGDRLQVLPSGRESTVKEVVTYDGSLPLAVAGQSVTVTLADEVDVSRGDVLAAAAAPPDVATALRATIVWMADEPMPVGGSYIVKVGTQTAVATVAGIEHRVDVDTLEHHPARQLELNEIGVCELDLDRRVVFDPYTENRETGALILVDRISYDTVAGGMIQEALRRSSAVSWQHVDLDGRMRAKALGQRACAIWLTGISGAGKSTLANFLERQLHALGRHTYLLDGDNLRHGLTGDLGFTDADRAENIRRVSEVAALMVDAGLIVVIASIAPLREQRRAARERIGDERFVEVFVDTPLAVAEQRDRKGLYARARRGELASFTGIDSAYEAPERSDVRVDTASTSVEAATQLIIDHLQSRRLLDSEEGS